MVAEEEEVEEEHVAELEQGDERAAQPQPPQPRRRARDQVAEEDEAFIQIQEGGFGMLERELGALSSRVQGVEAQLQTMNERLLGLEDSLRPLASIDQSLRRLGDAADSLFPRPPLLPAAPRCRWPLRPRTRGGLSSPPRLRGRGRRGRRGGPN